LIPPPSRIALALLIVAALPAESAAGRVGFLAVADGYWQVWEIAPDGSGEHRITSSPGDKTRCSWYPDGEHLLVNTLDGRVLKVARGSGQEERIPIPFEGVLDAVLSPTGRWIAFSVSTANSKDANEIWIVRADGSGLERLTVMKHLQHEPAWSPDERWIYFLSGDGVQAHDIWRVEVRSQNTEQLTAGELYHFNVAVSPGGTLAYSGNRTGNYEIWIRDEKGSAAPLAADPAFDESPSWSPDGTSVIFASTRGGPINLWKARPGDGQAEPLTNHPQGARAPCWWSPPAKGTVR
jgi:TolB protein